MFSLTPGEHTEARSSLWRPPSHLQSRTSLNWIIRGNLLSIRLHPPPPLPPPRGVPLLPPSPSHRAARRGRQSGCFVFSDVKLRGEKMPSCSAARRAAGRCCEHAQCSRSVGSCMAALLSGAAGKERCKRPIFRDRANEMKKKINQ